MAALVLVLKDIIAYCGLHTASFTSFDTLFMVTITLEEETGGINKEH